MIRKVSLSGIYRCDSLPLDYTVDGDLITGPDTYPKTERDEDDNSIICKTSERVAQINMKKVPLKDFKESLKDRT